ncbi:hypothetical protein P692DRAFT_20864971 [Suillus brevipes Sb2]|nr:hypothetical protein P692DRAFT_20864971 [Suillus brevipes Sb2]
MQAQLYLHKVCSAATAVKKVERHAISDPEFIQPWLDQMNETLVRMMDDSRIHRLEQQLDFDSVGKKLEPQASERRQMFCHSERSQFNNTRWTNTNNRSRTDKKDKLWSAKIPLIASEPMIQFDANKNMRKPGLPLSTAFRQRKLGHIKPFLKGAQASDVVIDFRQQCQCNVPSHHVRVGVQIQVVH